MDYSPVRSDWIEAVTRQLQVAAGDLAVLPCQKRCTYLKEIIESLPPPKTIVESLVLDGLSARAFHTLFYQRQVEGGSQPALSRRIRLLLSDRYIERWTAKKVARELGESVEAVQRELLRSHGITLHEYLTHERMAAAADLLVRTDTKVEAIAYEVGYRSKRNFFVQFERAFGRTPRDFRESYRNRA